MLKIISISGLDGSGKSTQTNLLKNYLETQGKRVFYFHAVKFSLANKLSNFTKKLFYKIRRSKQNIKTKSSAKANFITLWLRKFFLKIDLKRFKKLYKKLEKQNYDYILSDRYFYDSIINIAYLSNGHPMSKFWTSDVQKPAVAIYLKVDPEIIMQRKRKPDQGIEYLKKKELLYSRVLNKWNLITIDGNRLPEIVFEEIKKISHLP